MSERRLDEEHRRRLELAPAVVLTRLPQLAEAWNGEWQSAGAEPGTDGRLGLPITAGLRRGWVAGTVSVEPLGDDGASSHLVYRIDRGEIRTDGAAVFILALGALGGLTTVVAPFFPGLFTLVPVGIILGFCAWLMVVARLRNAGPAEFLDQLDDA